MTSEAKTQTDNISIRPETRPGIRSQAQPRPGFFERPIGLPLTLIALTAIWCFFYSTITPLLLVVIFVFLFMGLRRPVWAMAALVIHQATILSYRIPTPFGFEISLQLVILILAGLIIWRSYVREGIDLGPRAALLIPLAIVLVVIAMASDLVNSGFAVAWDDFRDWAVCLMILSFIPMVVRSIGDLKIISGVALVVLSVSALVSILQHYNILGMQAATLLPGLMQTGSDLRSPGISGGALELSYLASTVLLALFGAWALKGLKPNIRWLAPLILIALAAAVYFTFTRSAIIGVGLGLAAMLLLVKTRIQSWIVMVGALLVAIILIFSPLGNQYLAGRSAAVQEDSAVSRIILWEAGANIALDHPVLGIGSGNFNTLSTQYQSSVDSSLLAYEKREYWSYRTLGSEPPHNDFINIWLSYGTPALIFFIGLFVLIISNFTLAYRRSRSFFIRGLSIGLAAALVAYGVNALYHNMISTMPLFWILGGLSLALAKLALQRQPG